LGEGIYVYTLDETDSGITLPGRENEGVDYSKAKYELEFWVEKDSGGTLFVKFVCAKIVAGFIDEYYPGDAGGKKIDPTPGGKNQIPVVTIEDGFSQVIFTNKYWGSDGGGTTDPTKAAFEVKKIITGNGAEMTKLFDFDVKVTQPGFIPTAQEYKAYVQSYDGSVWTNVGNVIEFTSGVEIKGIKLTHNQRIAFIDLHVAANVEVIESAADGYTITYNRTFANPGTYTATQANMAWGFPRDTWDIGPHIIASGNDNTATFINARTGANPMGLSVDNLPYVLMIAFGMAALGGYIAIKTRKRADSQITA
jgi:hypothetical protein